MQPLVVVVRQHSLETGKQIALLTRHRLELPLVEQQAVVTHQHDVVLHNPVGERILFPVLDEATDLLHQLPHQLFLALGRVQGLVHVVGEEMILIEPLLKHRAAHELGIKQQHPPVVKLTFAVIGLADDIEIVNTPELVKYIQDFTAKHLVPL